MGEMCHSDPPMVQGGFVEAMLDHCSAMAGIAFTRCDCTMPASLEVTTSFLQPTRLNRCTATVKSAVMTYSTAFLEIELYDSVTDAKLATMSTVQKLGRKAISPTFAPFAEQPPFVGKQVVPAPDMTPNIRAITWDDLRSEPADLLERKYFRLWEAPAKMQAQPMHRLLQQRLLSVSVADQSITMGFVLEEAQTHDGIACGGIVSAFLDQAMTYACFFTSAMSDSKPARSLATISMRTVYLKPLPGPFPKRVQCTGRVVQLGGRVAFLAGALYDVDGDGTEVAEATCQGILTRELRVALSEEDEAEAAKYFRYASTSSIKARI